MRPFLLFVSLAAFVCLAETPRACVGSQSLASFRLVVVPPKGGRTLPIREVNALHKGQMLLYEPVHIPFPVKDKAEIAVLLGPANSREGLEALKPEPANKATIWTLPRDASVVALVYGPQGLNMRKVKSLMQQDDDVLAQLADYADQTSQIASLIEALQQSGSGGAGVSAALAGFSARSGVVMPAIDPHAATSQQAAALLHALQPAMTAMDPLTASNTAVLQQSAGLATTVASIFLGSGVGLAAGGVSLFQNMRTMLFPATEFRSTIAQTGASEALCLCAKSQPAKARTRVAYLWAHRLPELAEPKLSLAAPAHLPVASKSVVVVHAESGLKDIARLRDWQLTPVKGAESFHVPATVSKAGDEIQLDLTKVKAAPGEYRLKAIWDWDDLPVAGDVYLHPLGDLKLARLAPGLCDRLVEGGGKVPLRLEGTDFEFVEKVSFGSTILPFHLPQGKRGGEQQSIEAELDTKGLLSGAYKLVLAQSDGVPHPIPVTLLPPNPKIADLPLRPNTGETAQKLPLTGSGLERIETITTGAGEVEVLAHSAVVLKLKPGAHKGDHFDLRLKVQGLDAPLLLADAVEIQGPRPHIGSVRRSSPQSFGLALEPDEIPAAVAASFALTVANAGDQPVVEVTCMETGPQRQKLRLSAGDRRAGGRLDMAGDGVLFLSLEPGAVGRSGCRLEARVMSAEGTSDPFPLGRILRVPHIEQFTMTDQKLGDAVYAGTLKGEDLDTIEQTGWDPQQGLAVQSIPDSIAGEPQKQLLKIEQPWPSPAPHAPVYVWLRGESNGRATGVKY